MNWFSHGCPVCHGDLHDDMNSKGWMICLMCGRSYASDQIKPKPKLHAVPRSGDLLGDDEGPPLARTA